MKKTLLFFGLFVTIFAAASLEWIHSKFSRINFDEVMISVNSGIQEADAGYIYSFLNHAIVTPLAILCLILLLCMKFDKKIVLRVSYAIAGIYLLFQMTKIEAGSLFSKPSDFYEKEYISPKDVKIEFKEKRNVILIVLESIEKSYQNKKMFGSLGLIPNVENLEKQNISFPDYIEYSGMTFTIGAMIGMLCGVPLIYNGSGRTTKAGNAIGLGNILSDNGYKTYAFMASSGRYTNKEKTFGNKGFQKIIGGDKIKKAADERKVFSGNYYGGTDDLTMFDFSKQEIQKIDKSKPYFILVETINTHIDGYLVESCKKIGFEQKDFKDIVKCEDKIVTDFVEWLRKFDRSAVIILINDHNTKNSEMNKTLAKVEHRNLSNIFMNTDIFDGAKFNRKVFAPDFFPTVIEAAGGIIPGCRLGLGTSLSARCGNVRTLRERYGEPELRKMLGSKNKLYNSLMGAN